MRFGRYLQYFTGDECDPEDRMTDSEARINWMKETKHKIKVYSHKKQKHEVVEVVSVEVKRTRHQEQIGAEKSRATQVTEQVNNATDQQASQAVTRVMATLSESFEDDMFSEFRLQWEQHGLIDPLLHCRRHTATLQSYCLDGWLSGFILELWLTWSGMYVYCIPDFPVVICDTHPSSTYTYYLPCPQSTQEPSLKWMGKFMNEDTAIDGEGDGGNGKRTVFIYLFVFVCVCVLAVGCCVKNCERLPSLA